jgi:serine/threonine protein kinase
MPHALDPNRWTHIESLFHAALELEPASRLQFLQNQSQGDTDLVNEVLSLLGASSKSAGFLAKPISHIVREVAGEPELDRLSEGTLLNHYRILAKIGTGGMGQVYRALDSRLGRHVALKVLAPYLTFDEPAFRRFQQEAHAASALNHPNILTVFEFGEMDSLHYIATEFIDGPTLRQQLQTGPVELQAAVACAIQIAEALVAAHASGIIHRDIKPENILIRTDGLVKLVDFGIAKLAQFGETHTYESTSLSALSPALNPTHAGTVVGTPRYMSPEQARQIPVDTRSDLFSLGAVLYEMLAGTPAFTGASHEQIAHQILDIDPPGFAEFGIEIPPELELIVEKSLRKERDARYQTARDLLVDLQQFKRKLEFEANLIRAGFTPGGSLRVRPLGETPSGSNRLDRSGPVPQPPASSRIKLVLLSIAATLVPSVIVVFLVLARNHPNAPTPDARPDAQRSIAILPFRNLNQDPATDFLQVSLADALITKLGYVRALRVRSSADVKAFRGSDRNPLRNPAPTPRQIAGQLHADLLLTGSYERQGNNLLINTQLLEAKPDTVLWHHTINIPYDQLFTVQDQLAMQVIEGLSLKLSTAESQRIAIDRPENTKAYEYYLRGVDLYSLNEFTQAIDVLNKSIALDPDYALAWAQLGRAYTTHASLQFGGHEQYVRASEAYDKALSLDPGLVVVRVYMANLLTDTGRVEEAVPLLREAIQTDPDFAEAHWELGYAYRFAGMLDQSVAESEHSRRIDPDVKINSSAINGYLYRGEYRKFLDSIPAGSSGYTLFYRGLAEYYLNDFPAAQADFDRAYQLDRNILPAPIGEAISDGLKHHPAEGLKLLHATETRFNQQGVSDPEMLYKLAQGYALLDDPQSALRVLQQSADGGFFCAPYLAKDHLIDSLREYPRFKALQTQIQTRHDQFQQRFLPSPVSNGKSD